MNRHPLFCKVTVRPIAADRGRLSRVMMGINQLGHSQEYKKLASLLTTGTFGPLPFTIQPSLSVQPQGAANLPIDHHSAAASLGPAPDVGLKRMIATSASVGAQSEQHRNLSASLLDAFGSNLQDVEETTKLAWLETLATDYPNGVLPYKNLCVRPARGHDTHWSSTVFLESQDNVGSNDLAFFPRPVLSSNAILASFVTSIDGYGTGRGTAQPDGNNHDSTRGTCRLDGASSTIDIAFTTISIELFSAFGVPGRWKLGWLDALYGRQRNEYPVRGLVLGFQVASMYVHPQFRHHGVGRIQAGFLASIIRLITDEIVAQIETASAASAILYEEADPRRYNVANADVSIMVMGRSPDARGDGVAKQMMRSVFSYYGEDYLSPASCNGGRRLEALRSFARFAVENKTPQLREELRSIVSDYASRARVAQRTLGNVAARPSTVVYDVIDWSCDRDETFGSG